jgi:hypothetical protein
MPSATDLISFPRFVESHRSSELQPKFAREVHLEADLKSRENHYRADLDRFRWVQDHLNECWFALLVRRRVDSGV